MTKQKNELACSGVMHYVSHNFGEWEIETRHMTRVQKSIYLDMRTEYLKKGESLTSDVELLAHRLSCHNDEETQALLMILRDKFKLNKRTKSYKHSAWDTILKNYRARNWKNSTSEVTNDDDVTTNIINTTSNIPLNEAQRKAKSRKESKVIREKLSSIGIDSKEVKSVTELRKIFDKYKSMIELTSENKNVTSDVTDGHNECHPIVTQKDTITNKQKLEINNYKKEINCEKWREEKFELFYAAYPNKKSRGTAETTWRSVFTGTGKGAKVKHKRPDNPQALFDRIMKAVKDQTPVIQVSEYQKHPSSWLNAKSWEDEPTMVKASPTMNGKSYNRATDPQAVNDYWGNPGADMTEEEKKSWIGDHEYYDENKHCISY